MEGNGVDRRIKRRRKVAQLQEYSRNYIRGLTSAVGEFKDEVDLRSVGV
jgi:hypothetical protein